MGRYRQVDAVPCTVRPWVDRSCHAPVFSRGSVLPLVAPGFGGPLAPNRALTAPAARCAPDTHAQSAARPPSPSPTNVPLVEHALPLDARASAFTSAGSAHVTSAAATLRPAHEADERRVRRAAAAVSGRVIRATSPSMETKPPIPLAVLVGIQMPDVDDVAHQASLEELGRL